MFWINCMPFVFIGDVLTPHSTTADGLSAHCLLTNSACCVKCVLDGLELWYNIRDCYPAAGELPSHLQPCSMFCRDLKLTSLVCMPTSVFFYAFMLNIWLLELSCPSHQNEQLLQVCCMDSTMRDCFPEPWWHWNSSNCSSTCSGLQKPVMVSVSQNWPLPFTSALKCWLPTYSLSFESCSSLVLSPRNSLQHV